MDIVQPAVYDKIPRQQPITFLTAAEYTGPMDREAPGCRGHVDRHTARPVDLSTWQRVDSELRTLKGEPHGLWWNRHAGIALAVLLHDAEYHQDLQYRDLKFFAQVITPCLGVSRETVKGGTPPWPSFMTDDGTPIELSWDWGTGDALPTVRYSVEPIGPAAGTALDPGNLAIGAPFLQRLRRHLPLMRLEWFQHFWEFFNNPQDEGVVLAEDKADHNSSIFYAFDLSASGITAKVYFFPKMRAQACGRSSLDVLFQALETAPHVTRDNFQAASVFYDFCSDHANEALEHEMLSIDLIDPLRSRVKIYFRCRETTFDSVARIMTLGGRIKDERLVEGLQNIRQLWNGLFGMSVAPDQPLGNANHRTAGILYNIEFRLGDALPVAKVYLPVRHYASSDEAVIRGLDAYLQSHQRAKHMPRYVQTMNTLL